MKEFNMSTNDSLHELRAKGDPAAEVLIRDALRRSGRTPNQLLAFLRMPISGQPMWLHDLLDEWVRQGPALPSWADTALIEAGQQFFDDWDLAICTALFSASLPSAYAGAQGVRVLAPVSQLARPGTVALRIGETGQMLLDITEPGALERNGAGYRKIIQVRMLHAVVREMLLENGAPGGKWPIVDGVPVNQEDLLATLTTFTVIVFRALRRMGIEVSPGAQEAYLHLWIVVGDLLGIIDAERLSRLQNAEDLTTDLQELLQGPSADGGFLMSVLLDEMELAMPLGWLHWPRTLVRFLIGDQVADMLDVPPAAWWSPVLSSAAALNRRMNSYTFVRHVNIFPSHLLGRRLIQHWIDREWRDGRQFSVSAERLQRWRIADDNRRVTDIRRRLRGRRQRLREARLRIPRGASPNSGEGLWRR